MLRAEVGAKKQRLPVLAESFDRQLVALVRAQPHSPGSGRLVAHEHFRPAAVSHACGGSHLEGGIGVEPVARDASRVLRVERQHPGREIEAVDILFRGPTGLHREEQFVGDGRPAS